ncbi:MAG: hypothetical protein FWE37_08975, partial [Spirochaetaceae bacterium]|nr:hypothetical protein [Spirochaetaceae bacterium]
MLKTFSKTVKTLPLLAVMGALVACGARANVVESGTWFETAYAVWIAPNNTEQFRVETRLNNGDWLAVDTELVRQINTATHTWRVDVPGLRNTAGSSYSLRILNAANNNVLATVNNLVATPFDRQGYAFSPNSVNGLTTTTGGYNEDGTVRADAEIIYVT